MEEYVANRKRIDEIVGDKPDLGLPVILPVSSVFNRGAVDLWQSTRDSKVRVRIPDETMLLRHPEGNLLIQGAEELYRGFLWELLPEQLRIWEALRYLAFHGELRLTPRRFKKYVLINEAEDELHPAGWPQLYAVAQLALKMKWAISLKEGHSYAINCQGIAKAIESDFSLKASIRRRYENTLHLRGHIRDLDKKAVITEGCRPDAEEYVLQYKPSDYEARVRLYTKLLDAGWVNSNIWRDAAQHECLIEDTYWVNPYVIDMSHFDENR